MPGIFKVGMSQRVPELRAEDQDLNSTGVPTPFEVEYYAFFDDAQRIEREVHLGLSDFHVQKEYFRTQLETVIKAIECRDTCRPLFRRPPKVTPPDPAALRAWQLEEDSLGLSTGKPNRSGTAYDAFMARNSPTWYQPSDQNHRHDSLPTAKNGSTLAPEVALPREATVEPDAKKADARGLKDRIRSAIKETKEHHAERAARREVIVRGDSAEPSGEES